MKLTILFGSSLENVGRVKPVLTLFGLACMMIGIAGAEPATDLFAPAAKGPKNTVVASRYS